MPFSIFKKTPSNSNQQMLKRIKARELEENEKAIYEIDMLRTKISSQEKEISLMTSELHLNKQEINKKQTDNINLTQALTKAKLDIKQLKSNQQLDRNSKKTRSQEEIHRLQQQANDWNATYEKLQHEFKEANEKWKKTEAKLMEDRKKQALMITSLKEETDRLTNKASAKQKLTLEQEKVISELRTERNQREARITQLEKSLLKAETKRKEMEVDVNRIRQQLTEARQANLQLTGEVVNKPAPPTSGSTTKTRRNYSARIIAM